MNILITGALGALGLVTVKEALGLGHRVFTTALTPDHEALPILKKEKNFLGLDSGNLASDLDTKKICKRAHDVLSPLEAVIHIAGGFHYGNVASQTDIEVQNLMGMNYFSACNIIRHSVPYMQKQNKGRLVFVSSALTLNLSCQAKERRQGLGPYLASKSALNMAILSLAEEVKNDGVTVNGVALTIMDTEANRKAMPTLNPSKWVSPLQVAHTLLAFLDQDHVTGQIDEVNLTT